MKIYWTYCFCLLVGNLWAQTSFEDDFSSVALATAWQGDRDSFIINNGELQLNAQATGSSYLAVAALNADSCTWEIDFRLDFVPSGSNQLRIYLMADHPDPAQMNQAYFLQIGESGDDNIEFYKLSGSVNSLLAQDISDIVNDGQQIRLRVTRSPQAQWTMDVDYDDGNGFVQKGAFEDNSYNQLGFFSLSCEYTSSRADLFFFDNVRIAPLFVDTRPPQLLQALALEENRVELTFDEALNENIAENRNNYALDNGVVVGQVTLVEPTKVILDVTALSSGQTYQLTASNIEDEDGNAAAPQTVSFSYFEIAEAQPYDVLITEIFADPSPAIGLPEVEWVELYNRTDKAIDLADLQWVNGNSSVNLPSYILEGGEYALLCDEDAVPQLSALGDAIIGLADFGSLTNGGERISLTDLNGNTLHTVDYDLSWYGSSSKAEGGFSLEMINPEQPCLLAENWIGSADPSGGTPLRVNSVNDPDAIAGDFQLLRAFPLSEQSVELFFDRAVDAQAAMDISKYQFSDLLVLSAMVSNEAATSVLLVLNEPMDSNTVYELTVITTFTDCNGQALNENQVLRVALPESPVENDIVINELLFNPLIGGSEYIEFYNRSSKTINLQDLFVAKREGNVFQSISPVAQAYLFFPGDYVVLTKDRSDVLREYTVQNPTALIENNLPTFLNDEDTVLVYTIPFPDTQAVILDEFRYTDDLHSPLLDNDRGVSLERQNPDLPTNTSSTWQSAAETAGFGTPTYRNSQFFELDTVSRASSGLQIRLENQRFSPDGDSFEDVLRILYETDMPGYIASARIYDSRGREVKQLFRSQSLANQGLFTWDGSTDDGFKALTGIYVLWVEAFLPTGEKEVVKKAVVLAGQME